MQTLTQPTLLLKPFAESGDKNSIPVTNTDVSNPQLADLTNGFPQITSETPDDGGLPPERKDFNGLGYLTTTYDYFSQAGGTYTFNQTVSDAIGGYPEGARLWYTPASGETIIVRSLIQNNTYNFNSDPSYIDGVKWKVDTPTLDGNNIWTNYNTFTGTTLLKNPYLSKIDSNIDGGQINFDGADNEVNYGKNIGIDRYNGTLRIFGYDSASNFRIPLTVDIQNNLVTSFGLVLNKESLDKVGGVLKFASGDNETNTGKEVKIYRYDGGLQFEGTKSDNNVVSPMRIDIQADKVFLDANAQSELNKQMMPNYNAAVQVTTGYSAASNGLFFLYIPGRAVGNFTIGAITYTFNFDYNYTEASWLTFPVPKGQSITFSGIEVYFVPSIGG